MTLKHLLAHLLHLNTGYMKSHFEGDDLVMCWYCWVCRKPSHCHIVDQHALGIDTW
jgi:hypothetical protein